MKETKDAVRKEESGEFRLEEFLPYRLSVAAESVSRLIARQHLSQTGLSMPECRLLSAIGRFGVLSPTIAGERTSMDKVKVSRAATSLVARGLVKQSQDPDDGRGRLLRLTKKGTGLYNSIPPMARNIEETLSRGLSKNELSSLRGALAKLVDHTQSILNDTQHQAAD